MSASLAVKVFLRRIRLLSALVTWGCTAKAVPVTLHPLCVIEGARRWEIPAVGTRDLRVWMDREAQDFDGWRPYGGRRLRFAMDEWNVLRLPIRFVEATSARDSDITVDVIESVPVPDERTGRDQAAVTSLTYHTSGVITRARILIAVSAPGGGRYPLVDQQANLLHELGHAIGLPHLNETGAVMAVRRTSYSLTGADITLARAHYARCKQS